MLKSLAILLACLLWCGGSQASELYKVSRAPAAPLPTVTPAYPPGATGYNAPAAPPARPVPHQPTSIAASPHPAAPGTSRSFSRMIPGQRMSNPAPSGREEARAMWVVRYSMLSPQQVHAVVERAYRYHFNAIMVQVRGRGDAYYHSSIEPRAEGLNGQPAAFDPLAQAVQEAHTHSIKVFAWTDAMLVWSGKRPPRSPQHVVNLHPGWIDQRPDGSIMSRSDYEGQFLNPGLRAVREYTVGVCRDLVRHYDVDGIQLDYIRYPGPGLGYNPECMAGFYSYLHPGVAGVSGSTIRAETKAHPGLWLQWRQQQVTELVREIRDGIHEEKPWVSLSAAVWSDLQDARENRMQDWPTWLREGLVDFVCPMAYSTNTARVVDQIRRAISLENGRQVWAGLGAWMEKPPQIASKIKAMRQLGAAGICLFSYDGITQGGETDNYLIQLYRGPFHQAAAFPSMPWLPDQNAVASMQHSNPNRS